MTINRSLSAIAAAAIVIAGVVGAVPAFAWGTVSPTSAASILSENSEFGALISPPTMPQVALFGTPYPYGF